MSRAVRFALWDYQQGQGLTAVCDTDVDTFCPKVRLGLFAGLTGLRCAHRANTWGCKCCGCRWQPGLLLVWSMLPGCRGTTLPFLSFSHCILRHAAVCGGANLPSACVVVVCLVLSPRAQ